MLTLRGHMLTVRMKALRIRLYLFQLLLLIQAFAGIGEAHSQSLGGLILDAQETVAGITDALSGKADYPVIESGYWIADPKPIYWIDNQNVLFVGGEMKNQAALEPESAGGPAKHDLNVWNLTTGNVRTHAKIIRRSGICYSKERIEFTTDIDGDFRMRKIGIFGKETEVREPASAVRAKGWVPDRFNCGGYSFFKLPKGADIPLREGHGYLGWKGGINRPWQEEKDTPLRYYRDAQSPAVILPLTRKDVREPNAASQLNFAAWANVYLLLGGVEWNNIAQRGQLAKDKPFPVHLLTPGTGELKALHAWYQADIGNWQYFYTKVGLLVFSGHLVRGRIGRAGIYRVVGREYEKIIRGIPMIGALSPDGCRLAVGMQYIDQKGFHGPVQLKVIDLCKGAK